VIPARVLALCLAAHAGAPSPPPATPAEADAVRNEAQAAAEAIRIEARAAAARGDRRGAAEKLWRFASEARTSWPESAAWVDEAARWLAEAGDVDGAAARLLEFAARSAGAADRHRLRMRAAILLVEGDRLERARPILEELASGFLPPGARQEVELVLGECEFDLGFRHGAGGAAAPSGRALAASARERLRTAFGAVHRRLVAGPGGDGALLAALAERLGCDGAEMDLWLSGEAAARRSLDEIARLCRGRAPGPAFERAIADLDWTGRKLPARLGVPLDGSRSGRRPEAASGPSGPASGEAEAAAAAGTRIRVVHFWASWCPESVDRLRDIDRLVARLGPEAPVEAAGVSLDEPERLAAARRAVATRRLAWRQAWLPGSWDSREARALGLDRRGIPWTVIAAPDGTIVRAGLTGRFLERTVRREITRIAAAAAAAGTPARRAPGVP
jgi:hypothetical protein